MLQNGVYNINKGGGKMFNQSLLYDIYLDKHVDEVLNIEVYKDIYKEEEENLRNALSDEDKKLVDHFLFDLNIAYEKLMEKNMKDIMHFGIKIGLEIHNHWKEYEEKYYM